MIVRIAIIIVLCGTLFVTAGEAAEYALARSATPVLNNPDFAAVFGGTNGQELKTDRCGQVRELEYIAMPGTAFTIIKKLIFGLATIFQVETDEYKASPNVRLYVDGRFVELKQIPPEPRRPLLPPREKIIATLRSSRGNPYVWGGNIPGGVPELVDWFYRGIKKEDTGRLSLAGLDCSGLLYHATEGWTPRNTSQLITFGQGVAIAGKKAVEIASLLQPLDLIVWNGHVIIVLDPETAIESRLECGKAGNGGVVTTPVPLRIAEIMRTRHPENIWNSQKKQQDIFVVRRWYDAAKTTPSEKNSL